MVGIRTGGGGNPIARAFLECESYIVAPRLLENGTECGNGSSQPWS
jgi:hypothetical protein